MDITTGLVQSSREHWRCRAVSRCFSGLTEGDQVQLTKGWQQNSELQFLGRRVRMDEMGSPGMMTWSKPVKTQCWILLVLLSAVANGYRLWSHI